MVNKNIPYLCGGTFFVLLLQIKKLRSKARDRFNGGSDGLNDTDLMKGLVYVVTGQNVNPYNDSFKKNTSEYKSCKYNGGTYIPFNDISTINSFDNAVKHKNSDTLKRMSEFVNEYLIVENPDKREWLIKALLEVIEHDTEIKDEDLLYINGDVEPVIKSKLSRIENIDLESFLIGILHYIMLYRKTNTIGRKTFESWHNKESPHSEWTFISAIGTAIKHKLSISMMAVEKEDTSRYSKIEEEIPEPEMIIDEAESAVKNVMQIINNPTIINQHGEKNIHIERVDILNL